MTEKNEEPLSYLPLDDSLLRDRTKVARDSIRTGVKPFLSKVPGKRKDDDVGESAIQ